MSRVIEIVKAHLVAGGFNGLLQEDAECGCELADLVPCCGDFSSCTPAYRGPDPTGEGDWRMYSTKQTKEPDPASQHDAAPPLDHHRV